MASLNGNWRQRTPSLGPRRSARVACVPQATRAAGAADRPAGSTPGGFRDRGTWSVVLFSPLPIGFVEVDQPDREAGNGRAALLRGDIAKLGVPLLAVVPKAASMLHSSWLRGS